MIWNGFPSNMDDSKFLQIRTDDDLDSGPEDSLTRKAKDASLIGTATWGRIHSGCAFVGTLWGGRPPSASRRLDLCLAFETDITSTQLHVMDRSALNRSFRLR